jgi:hypothetical protein
MSHRIESITVNELTDKRIIQRNGSMARLLSIGNDWTTIRLGVRWATADIGFAPGAGSTLAFGMMSNPSADLANGPLTNATSHFVGGQLRSGTALGRATSPVAHYTNVSCVGERRIGSTNSGSTGVANLLVSAVPHVRTAFIVQINKGETQFNLSSVFLSGSNGLVDIEKQTLISAMEIAALSDIPAWLNLEIGGSGTRYSASTSTVTGTEAAGDLDGLVLGWSRSAWPMIYSDVFWAKVA